MSNAPSIEKSAMVSRRGRGRDRDFEGGVTHLEEVVVLMVVKLLIRDRGNVSIAGGITNSLISVGRSFVALNGHNLLMLTLLPW